MANTMQGFDPYWLPELELRGRWVNNSNTLEKLVNLSGLLLLPPLHKWSNCFYLTGLLWGPTDESDGSYLKSQHLGSRDRRVANLSKTGICSKFLSQDKQARGSDHAYNLRTRGRGRKTYTTSRPLRAI